MEIVEQEAYVISLEKDPIIKIRVVPGHFATVSSHTNSYLDMSGLKNKSLEARDVARELALPYLSSASVETIVCIERTQIIAAYLAEELADSGLVVNSNNDINILTPISNINGQWIFQDNVLDMIADKDIVLLVPTISSGRTVQNVMNCINYYGGNLVGISVLFLISGINLSEEVKKILHPLFTTEDAPDFRTYEVGECEMCRAGQKLDALINSEGYRSLSG